MYVVVSKNSFGTKFKRRFETREGLNEYTNMLDSHNIKYFVYEEKGCCKWL